MPQKAKNNSCSRKNSLWLVNSKPELLQNRHKSL